MNSPLAERMRPRSLTDYVGQDHLIGEGAAFRKALESGILPSLIFWGPPGTGKTTLANIIATLLKRPFHVLSAINSGVKDIREVIEKAGSQQFFGTNKPVLFIDEIHRFSKSQQDSLLNAVERGTITLIGATTENPSFEVIPALLSRCQVYVLQHLTGEQLKLLVLKAIKQDEVLKTRQILVQEWEALLRISGGDARKLLNAVELVVTSQWNEDPIIIKNELVVQVIQQNSARYDKSGEQHYDIISAFIKSIRGSDPNAAVYWLARMLDGGEDPKFIARRLLILASEDIGNANPTALILATSCFQAVERLGMPEGRITLSQCTIYLASSPKSNSSYLAIDDALAEVKKSGDLAVPISLRNAPTGLMRELNYGKDYQYAHSYEGNFVAHEFLPEFLAGTKFFEPGGNPREEEIRKFLKVRWREKYDY
jgi:putative ATPase